MEPIVYVVVRKNVEMPDDRGDLVSFHMTLAEAEEACDQAFEIMKYAYRNDDLYFEVISNF